MEEKKLSWYQVRAIPKDNPREYIKKDWFALDWESAVSLMQMFLSMDLHLDSTKYFYIARLIEKKEEEGEK